MKVLIYVAVFFVYSVLKPFMDTLLYNIFSTSYFYDSDDIAIRCGVASAILAVLAFICADRLCKVWDKRNLSKKSANTNESPITDGCLPPQPEPEPTITAPSSPAPATPKLRYCRHCGSPIDPATRQCTGCGKQYFRPPVLHKKHLAIAAGVLACAAVMFLVFNLASRLNAAEAKVEELSAQITDLNAKLEEQKDILHGKEKVNAALKSSFDNLQKNYDALREENTMNKDLLSFYEEYVACIGDTGDMIYHRFPCPYMEMDSGWVIFSVPFAESQGYDPCPYCRG